MKILHIVPSYWPAFERGGPIVSVHLLNKWLVKSGADVTVYTTNIGLEGKVETKKEVILDGVRVWYFPLTWKGWQYSCALQTKLKETVKDFDVVHITSVFLAASTMGACYAKKNHVPYIISPRGNLMTETIKHNAFKKNLYLSLIEKRNLAGAAAIHFTDKKEEEEYKKMDLPLKKSFVVPNGLDPEEFDNAKNSLKGSFRKKYNIPGNKKIVLFLGRINWKKGFDTLIPAFHEVVKKNPEAVLVIAGSDEGGYKKTVQKMLDEQKLTKNVVFTGLISGEERTSAFMDGDMFVLPSYSENFGMAVIEAMYMRVPVIVTSGVALSKDIARVGAGIVVEKNIEQLVKAIVSVLQNPGKMGEVGRALVEKNYFIGKIADELIKEYTNLIKG